MQELSWEEVLRDESLIGQEIEVQEGASVELHTRGRLGRIEREGDQICFYFLWCAERTTGQWKRLEQGEARPVSVMESRSTPVKNDDGEIVIDTGWLFKIILRPNGHHKLDPNDVSGLQ